MQHSVTDQAIVLEQTDSLVLSLGHQRVDHLVEILEGIVPIHVIGDCLAPRTAEEAILDGLKIGSEI
jgi:hypothetical protein